MSDILTEIKVERDRQINEEGWTTDHDDNHGNHVLSRAAACYALASIPDFFKFGSWVRESVIPKLWPWSKDWWKPVDRRRNLVKAAALIVAEIERLDRKK